MKFILGLGKVLTVAFWGVVLFNQLMPQPLPFNLLINAAGIVLFGLHLLEVLFFNRSLRGRSHRWFDPFANPADGYLPCHVHSPSAGGAAGELILQRL